MINLRKYRPCLKLLMIIVIIAFSISEEILSQTHFTKWPDNPVIDIEPGTSRAQACFPAVIFHEDVFKMYYSGWGSYNLRQIFYAESTDGIDWWEDSDPVIGSEYPYGWHKHKFPCSVLWVDDTMRLWYWGSINWTQFAIGYAWSEDGEDWNVNPTPVMEKGEAGSWDSEYVMWPAVIYDSGLYHMWYSGSNNWYDDYIFYASSTDGIKWEKSPFPVIDNGPDGSYYDLYVEAGGAIKYNDTIYMYFNGWDGQNYRIGFAWSTDYFNWEVSDTAILDIGEDPAWDSQSVGPASVLVHEEQLKMWFGGQRGVIYGIGYAEGDSIWDPATSYEEMVNEKPIKMSIFPNPCSGEFHLRYSILDPSTSLRIGSRNSKFELYSIQGVKLMTLMDELLEAGEYEFTFDISNLPAGIYFCVMKSESLKYVEKVVKY